MNSKKVKALRRKLKEDSSIPNESTYVNMLGGKETHKKSFMFLLGKKVDTLVPVTMKLDPNCFKGRLKQLKKEYKTI